MINSETVHRNKQPPDLWTEDTFRLKHLVSSDREEFRKEFHSKKKRMFVNLFKN